MKTLEQYIEQYGEIEGPKKYKLNLYRREWYQKHGGCAAYRKKVVPRELNNKYCREYQARHREPQRQRMNKYHITIEGRAQNLLGAYRTYDLRYLGVEGNITRDYIIRHCMTPGCKCIYCGESDIFRLGLDRISNEKPHDISNCVCSCRSCNTKRHSKKIDEWLTMTGIDFEAWGTDSDGLRISYDD